MQSVSASHSGIFFVKKLNVSSIYEILSPSGIEYPHYVFEILTDHSQRVLNTGGYGDLSTLRASLESSIGYRGSSVDIANSQGATNKSPTVFVSLYTRSVTCSLQQPYLVRRLITGF